MKITVYGRDRCANCKTITEGLNASQQDYTYRDVDKLIDLWQATRDLELLDVRAQLCISDEVPVVVVDGLTMGYEGALWAFGLRADDKCTDGVCKL